MAQTANAPGSGGPRAAAATLTALTGALDDHLEHRGAPDPQAPDAEADGMAELAALRAALHAYAGHWTAPAIAADAGRFACATAVVGERLRMRLEPENAGVARRARVA